MRASAQVRLGAGLVWASAAIVVVTMWFLRPGEAALRVVIIQVVAALAAAVLALARPNTDSESGWLLGFPAILAAQAAATANASHSVGAAYTGLLMVGFIYVGLTQRRWTSVFLVPFAAGAWWYCQLGPTNLVWVKLAIGVMTWILVAELLAVRSVSYRARIGELTTAADTDYLTGLGNRRGLASALDLLETGNTVVLLDLDHFKDVNDSLGHAAGDEVIREFALAARSVLRARDHAFRFGGEELVVIMTGGDGSDAGARSLFVRLREVWSTEQRPTFSGGACVHLGGSPSETLNRADQALYHAKKAGRNRWIIATDSSEVR